MKKIKIYELFSASERMTREGGEKLRNILKSENVTVELDLENKPLASVSFWDEGIAKLLLDGWTPAELKKKIQFKDIHPRDLKIVQALMKERNSDK